MRSSDENMQLQFDATLIYARQKVYVAPWNSLLTGRTLYFNGLNASANAFCCGL